MKTKSLEVEVDYIGSQDPAMQPTAEELAALSRYFKEQKQRRVAEEAAKPAVRVRRKTAA